MTPISIAVIPSQPVDAEYGAQSLELFKRYDRASYLAAFGVDAPTYDPKRKSKAWFDSSPASPGPDGKIHYRALSTMQRSTDPQYDDLAMTADEAGTVNLYGVHSYPKYVQPPSDNPVIAARLPHICLRADAAALAAEWNVPDAAVLDGDTDFSSPYPANEARRIWIILYKGQALVAQHFIAEKNGAGVGAPGHWNFDGAEPNWISEIPQSLPPANPSVAVPQRDLLPNEKIITGPLGAGWQIIRTDLQPAAPSSGGGGLTAEEHAAVLMIPKLAAFFRIT